MGLFFFDSQLCSCSQIDCRQDGVRVKPYVVFLIFPNMENSIKKEVLTSTEAAQYLGLSKARLYKLTSERLIPHYKSGRLVYFNREELIAWMQRNRVATAAELEGKAADYCRKGGAL